jgi:uncharacterized protein YkwD
VLGAFAHILPCLLALSASEMEPAARKYVVSEFERVGRSAPALDPVLVEAARKLALDALDTSAEEAADVLSISGAISDANGADPTPRAVIVRANPPEYALESFTRRTDFNAEATSHMGVAVVQRGERAVVAALLAERKASLKPFPRALPAAGTSRTLCGELLALLRRPELYVTRPSGKVDKVAITRQSGASFCTPLLFPSEGRHTVEVIGRGPKGPEVAALFFVDVGAAREGAARAHLPEPAGVPSARRAVLERVNALRAALGLRGLELDEKLNEVAQAYSERMAQEGFFAHVAPDGEELRTRMGRAGYGYAKAGENLGLASGPLAAHFAIEHSPGHRRNLIDGIFTRLGVGIAFRPEGEHRQAIVTEVLADATGPSFPARDPIGDAYRSLDQLRVGHHLSALKRSPVLERLATSHAELALKADQPAAKLPTSSLHERVFAALSDVKSAAVDFVIADETGSLPDSKNLADGRNDQVGIGAVRGDSATFGKAKFWVVVIYTASR